MNRRPQTAVADSRVLTLREVAAYLRVSVKTVLRMARAGRIPALKVSNQWRFPRPLLDEWMLAHARVTVEGGATRESPSGETAVSLRDLLTPDIVSDALVPGGKAEVLGQLVRPLVARGTVRDGAAFVGDLLRREAVVSTAIGGGVAVPHVRASNGEATDGCCVAVGICRQGTDFGALDGRPVHVFVLPCTRDESEHLRVLARVFAVLRQPGVVAALRDAHGRRRIARTLWDAEDRLSGQARAGRQVAAKGKPRPRAVV